MTLVTNMTIHRSNAEPVADGVELGGRRVAHARTIHAGAPHQKGPAWGLLRITEVQRLHPSELNRSDAYQHSNTAKAIVGPVGNFKNWVNYLPSFDAFFASTQCSHIRAIVARDGLPLRRCLVDTRATLP